MILIRITVTDRSKLPLAREVLSEQGFLGREDSIVGNIGCIFDIKNCAPNTAIWDEYADIVNVLKMYKVPLHIKRYEIE